MLISNIYSILFLIVSVNEYSFDPLLPFRQKDTLVQKAAAAAAAVTLVRLRWQRRSVGQVTVWPIVVGDGARGGEQMGVHKSL